MAPRRGHLRAVRWTKVGHGLFRPSLPDGAAGVASAGPGLIGSSAWLADLRAWTLVLPPSGGFTHLTAAALYGWWLPPVPRGMPVFASVSGRESRPRRPGLIASRRNHAHPPLRRQGLPVDLPDEVLLRAARDLALLDMVVLVDAALRSRDCLREHLQDVSSTRRPGAVVLRQAIALADGRSESAWETVLRLFHAVCEVPVEPQFEVRDEHGRFVARGPAHLGNEGPPRVRRGRASRPLRESPRSGPRPEAAVRGLASSGIHRSRSRAQTPGDPAGSGYDARSTAPALAAAALVRDAPRVVAHRSRDSPTAGAVAAAIPERSEGRVIGPPPRAPPIERSKTTGNGLADLPSLTFRWAARRGGCRRGAGPMGGAGRGWTTLGQADRSGRRSANSVRKRSTMATSSASRTCPGARQVGLANRPRRKDTNFSPAMMSSVSSIQYEM